ncbi:MAG: carotenoid 1,2-hydratase [Acidobacteria bacterium]|nr:carotenoid 1,2-hydratase [Acidobacteriota bacterium]MCA1641027.1 carotenoid 1,2-hydratase [Acidobacteriota bacterium]
MSTNFIEPLGKLASDFFDLVTDAVVGEASTLRDGTEHAGVELPRDLYAHADAQTEWWYYTGHLKTARGRRFGFELVFFKRRTDLDRFGVVPLRLIANPLYLAHFALTDESRGEFRYDHRKSANNPFDLPAATSARRYFLKLGDWTVREADGVHLLRATLGGDLVFEAALKPAKPAALNGHQGVGVSFKDAGEASRYFSYTRMAAEGDITWRGETERFTGEAWMDREFGTWRTTENQKGWDWFSVQLSTGAELMVYHIRDAQGRPSPFSSGTFVDKDGKATHLAREDFQLEATAHWKSPHSGATYPSGWRLRVPRFGIDVSVTPVIRDQELDTRGTTMIVYWEGSCVVAGRHGDAEAEGRAYVELVGYDRSHESPSITSFLFGSALDRRWRSVFG